MNDHGLVPHFYIRFASTINIQKRKSDDMVQAMEYSPCEGRSKVDVGGERAPTANNSLDHPFAAFHH